MTSDSELLRSYAREHSEESFAALVNRHLSLVHSAALRQVRSPELAEEVAQSAFATLARHARGLAPDTILTAWLYQVTRRLAIDVVRREARRQLREQVAAELTAMNDQTADWTQIEPLLDDAMHALDETDRTAVLLRYFENKPFREVGQTLGTSEDAAQKRVTRAVDRLRQFFHKRGVAVGGSGLAVLISTNAVQAAPIGLSAIVSAAALSGATVAATATATLTKAIAMTTLQKTLIAATLVVAGVATPLAIQHQGQAKLREENQLLRRQADDLARLSAENARLSRLLTEATNPQTLPKDQFSELLKLRGEVGGLRRQTNELANALVSNQRSKPAPGGDRALQNSGGQAPSLHELVPKDSWAFVGYADPESAFQSAIWAMSQGDPKTIRSSLLPEGPLIKKWEGVPDDEVAARNKKEFEKVTAFKIIDKEVTSDDEVYLTVIASGINESGRFRIARVGNEWRVAGPAKAPGVSGSE
jgi:RNA polymerase sigma factor (sigma-70 family)